MRAQSSLPVSSVYGFGVWGAARSHDQKVKRLPLELATRSGTPGRSVGEVGGRFEKRRLRATSVLSFVSHSACPFRACLCATLETQRAVARV